MVNATGITAALKVTGSPLWRHDVVQKECQTGGQSRYGEKVFHHLQRLGWYLTTYIMQQPFYNDKVSKVM
jgi:hypothetical protein